MTIPALLPRDGSGHQFVCYADCCSGIPGRCNAERFAAVNAVLRRLDPQPEFILFPGDEIQGLLSDPEVLREQWRYWFEEEMAWLDRDATPLYHTTANHTVYDPQSETIFREVMAHLPGNGPPGQDGLSYFVRRGNLIMVFINTLWTGLGGEGRVETDWLEDTLSAHRDATHKLVIGHHPVFPTNGFTGDWQRQIERSDGQKLWQILVRHGVSAYLCSHMLAFDVHVHQGVLQILTAGAGTAPLMPETEYHHLVQAVVDGEGLRYQVLDAAGVVRESLDWPPMLPDSRCWEAWDPSAAVATFAAGLIAWRFRGALVSDDRGDPQTLLCGWADHAAPFSLWIGLRGLEQRLAVLIQRASGRSPHLWLGPALSGVRGPESEVRSPVSVDRHSEPATCHSELVEESLATATPAGATFGIQLALHQGMGPGGMLWRWDDASPWTTLINASSWGPEDLPWPAHWSTGCSRGDPDNQPFRGSDLHVVRF